MPWDPTVSPASLNVGDLAHIAATFTDLDGTATDPTEVTLEIQEPDGTNTSKTWGAGQVIRAGTGDFYFDFTVTQSGQHLYRWSASGALVGVDPGAFLVEPDQF